MNAIDILRVMCNVEWKTPLHTFNGWKIPKLTTTGHMFVISVDMVLDGLY